MNDTYVLRGRVATMAKPGEHLDGAQVAISGGRIAHVVKQGDQLPAAFAGAPVVDTKGTIYPGLIDLHNHFVYNVRPLWPLPRATTTAASGATPRYSAEISQAGQRARRLVQDASRSIVRYVEAKAVIGGTTTGQGIRTQVRGGSRLSAGPCATSSRRTTRSCPRPTRTSPTSAGKGVRLRRSTSRPASARAAGRDFYHLAEGIDARPPGALRRPAEHDLISPRWSGSTRLG